MLLQQDNIYEAKCQRGQWVILCVSKVNLRGHNGISFNNSCCKAFGKNYSKATNTHTLTQTNILHKAYYMLMNCVLC